MTKLDFKKKNIAFILILILFALASFLQNFESNLSNYMTTMFAINYDHGLIPNGFMGTVLKALDALFPFQLYSYLGLYNFTKIFTFIFYLVLFAFYILCLRNSREGQKKNQQYLIVFLSIYAFSMFSTGTNFGHFDIYLYIFTLISILLIVEEKWEWLIVPITIICMLIQQDFIFTHANIIFVLLLYKAFVGNTKKRNKYLFIAGLLLLSVLGLYIYFECFCTINGTTIVDDLMATAKGLSENGESYSNIIIKSDILQEDMTEYVAEYRHQNLIDLPTFCILFSPYIFFGVRYFIKLILNKTATPAKRFIYIAFLLGGAATIPMFVSDIYYGRYVFYVIFYYVALIIALVAMQDKDIENGLDALKTDLKKITPLTFIWIMYPLFLLPLRSIAISNAIHKFAEMFFG